MTTTTLLILTGAGFIAGFINAIAGAGGLITLPALLAAGVPPLTALGTNKCQSVFGTLLSSVNYLRRGQIKDRALLQPLTYAFVGSLLGSIAVQHLANDILAQLIPALLLLTALYYCRPKNHHEQRTALLTQQSFNRFIIGGLGFLCGFFGPGSGLFFAAAYSGLLGYPLLTATAQAKPLVLASNFTAFMAFAIAGYIHWPLAIAMGLAQMLGAYLGSNLAIKKGPGIIRPLVILMGVLLALKLLIDTL
jgi:uncharacterized membrane protein YfcA